MVYRCPPIVAAFCFAFALLGAGKAHAQLFETKAAQAFMIDAETGTILFSKDPDKLIPPASLAKLMTMEVVFNASSPAATRWMTRSWSARTPGGRAAPVPAVRRCLPN